VKCTREQTRWLNVAYVSSLSNMYFHICIFIIGHGLCEWWIWIFIVSHVYSCVYIQYAMWVCIYTNMHFHDRIRAYMYYIARYAHYDTLCYDTLCYDTLWHRPFHPFNHRLLVAESTYVTFVNFVSVTYEGVMPCMNESRHLRRRHVTYGGVMSSTNELRVNLCIRQHIITKRTNSV